MKARPKRRKTRELSSLETCWGSKWYKVLVPYMWEYPHNRRRLSGPYSRFLYPTNAIPHQGKPGRWMRVTGLLSMCRNGFHVTQIPRLWRCGHYHNYRVFEAQVTGIKRPSKAKHADLPQRKIVVRSMRLVREVRRGTVLWKKLEKRQVTR